MATTLRLLRPLKTCIPRRSLSRVATGYGPPSPPSDIENDSSAEFSADKIVVFGGSGFVGQRVCQAAVRFGADVVSINRNGPPKNKSWADDVRWVRGDIFKPTDYASEIAGATGVVSCVGAFGSNDFMEKICGDATVTAVQAANKAGAKRFVFISAAGSQHEHLFMKGYWKGKQKAEKAVRETFPEHGVILRASGVYGNRDVGPATVPLGLFMQPLEMLLKTRPFSILRSATPLEPVLTPPVSADNVGKVAAAGALGIVPSGVLLVDDINRLASKL